MTHDGGGGDLDNMKRILLEFIGGSWDGMNLDNDSPDKIEASLAARQYLLSNCGSKGAAIVLPSDYAVRSHGLDECRYRVTNRTEIGDEVLVRFEVCDHHAEDGPPSSIAEQSPARQITFQFDGGCLHGMTLDSRSPDLHEALLASAYYAVTRGGMPGSPLCGTLAAWQHLVPKKLAGRTFLQFSPIGMYRVIERCENDATITVRLCSEAGNRPDDGPKLGDSTETENKCTPSRKEAKP
jgi:hypothetical protein